MKIAGAILLSLYLFLGEALAIEPVGTIGKGYLGRLTFLPDGNLLRVMSSKHIEIVDPDNDMVLANFASGSEYFGTVIVSPDGGQLVNRRRDMVELCDINGQEKLGEWELESVRSWEGRVLDYPFLVAFGRTQPILAMNNGTDEIFLLDWKAGEWVGRLEDKRRPIHECYRRSGSNWSGSWSSSTCYDHSPFVFSIAFSPDDRFLVVGSRRPDAEIWDLETRKLIGHLEGHDGWVTKVVYSPDGQWIATTEVESTKVYLWNAETRQLVRTLRNGDIGASRAGEVFELFFSGDSRRLYVGTRTRYPAYTNTFNDRLRVWDVETNTLINEFRAEPTALKYVSVSPDESRAIFQYYDQVAVLWDLKQNRQLRLWADYGGTGWSSKLSPDGKSLVEVRRTLIKIWDVPSGTLRHVVFEGTQNYRQTLAISPDSRRFAVGLDTDGTEVRDIHNGELQAHFPNAWGRGTFTFSNRGNRIATGDYWRSGMVVLDVDQPHRHEILGVNAGGLIAFSADDRYLAAIDQHNRIHLWEQSEHGYSYRYAWIPPRRVNYTFGANLVFHPHATPPILVFAKYDTVVGWRLGEQAVEQLFRIDGKGPAHFSADGRYLFLNGEDGLQIWNWRANQPLEHPLVPEYLGVSRDGSVLVTRFTYPSPQIWDVTPLLQPKPMLFARVKKPALLVNFPNPFNPETWIPYQLSELAHVNIRIHDSSGRQVRTRDLGTKSAGDYLTRSQAAYWDGRNEAGEAVSSGLYFYTLQTGESRSTRRMNLVK